jgi:hypothetical protein
MSFVSRGCFLQKLSCTKDLCLISNVHIALFYSLINLLFFTLPLTGLCISLCLQTAFFIAWGCRIYETNVAACSIFAERTH